MLSTIAIAFASLSALIHFYFFLLESVLWNRRATRKIFQLSEQDAQTTKLLAFNQGFYNLFLVGAVLIGLTLGADGKILVDYAVGSMLLAGVVLYFSKNGMLRGAMIQSLPPTFYFIAQFAQN